MNSDRELLELAAKAFGLAIEFDADDEPFCTNCSDASWNPLADDGDALRLAVRLEIDITFNRKYVTACANSHAGTGFTSREKDRNAGVRIAIVRAAAEIGKEIL